MRKVHGEARDVDVAVDTGGYQPVDNVLQVSNNMLNIQPDDGFQLHQEQHLLVRVIPWPTLQQHLDHYTVHLAPKRNP